ncbi:MAG: non-canonical purine NTP pyrophosphatase, RdgB/HAM1 family [Bacteroidetes bacterium HGW-Bacteroidetes-21]|nr:MAG: non-canonical purine NTP pyrophosphatase, RdgB/HAM1 family [Bacteroidetes bacterium HGW-Bacteroidetes-21]
MKSIIFATNNLHKLEEVQQILHAKFKVMSLSEVGINEEIPEDHETLEENAMQKAEFVFARTGLPTFADDTGLEVESLGNLPGVYSARYAGPDKISADNVKKLLHELKDESNRKARFRCAIAYISSDEKRIFNGIVEGKIIHECRGRDGFGYDPVFVPDGNDLTFAEMSADEKNKISHRGRAVSLLAEYLLK